MTLTPVETWALFACIFLLAALTALVFRLLQQLREDDDQHRYREDYWNNPADQEVRL